MSDHLDHLDHLWCEDALLHTYHYPVISLANILLLICSNPSTLDIVTPNHLTK